MAVRAEVARASVHAAACTLDDPEVGDVARAVAGAKLLAGEAAIMNGKSARRSTAAWASRGRSTCTST